jgi:hypothetical protein
LQASFKGLDAKWCQGEGSQPLPGARMLGTRLAISRQLFDGWCHALADGVSSVASRSLRRRAGEAFDAHQVRGQSGTITAVVNALAKAGIELGENGSIIRRGSRVSQIKGAPTEARCGDLGGDRAPKHDSFGDD